MKRFTLTLLFINIFFTTPFCSFIKSSTLPYLLNLHNPNAISIDGLSAYYKGFEISLSEGRALLPECGTPTVFSLIITPSASFKMQGKTVTSLLRDPKQPCRWWDLTLISKDQEVDEEDRRSATGEQSQAEALAKTDEDKIVTREYTWDIKSVAKDDMPERLPEHAIVVLIDPQFIETITEIQSENSINLPTIVFKTIDESSKEAFEEAILFATMSRPDLRAINCRERPICLSALSAAAKLPRAPING